MLLPFCASYAHIILHRHKKFANYLKNLFSFCEYVSLSKLCGDVGEKSDRVVAQITSPISFADTIMGYRCVCPRSTTGSHCEHLLTGCMSNPCVHGICSETTTSYQCYCVPGNRVLHFLSINLPLQLNLFRFVRCSVHISPQLTLKAPTPPPTPHPPKKKKN